jgi:alpha-L-rhamnosidase
VSIRIAAGCLSALLLAATAWADDDAAAPIKLQTDDLATPLGLDDATPHFSWVLSDKRLGAVQTAYQIQIATRPELLATTPDVWDSGRVTSGQSVGVAYAGPKLAATTRYYWRVQAWDRDGEAYAASEASWWETGLMDAAAFGGAGRAKWIGYQNWEETELRNSGAAWITTRDGTELLAGTGPEQKVAYRLQFDLDHRVKKATLYVTGQDVASAWVNGTQVATGAALPAWKQLPWKKYVAIDVTAQAHRGPNMVGVEVTHYVLNRGGPADIPPMSAVLVALLDDGSTISYATSSGNEWSASIHPREGWTSGAVDASWKQVILYQPAPGVDFPGHPWPAQTVKALRHEFDVKKPVASARLYATALGSYQVMVNGKRAGDDVLAPGWTDYRLRLKYQTYDVTDSLRDGPNALGVLLAPGWYESPLQWYQQPNVYGTTPPSLIAELKITYTDGTVDWVATDDKWKAAESGTTKAEIYDGETQDLLQAIPGWIAAFFDDGKWNAVEVRTPELAGVKIDGQDFQPIRVEQVLKPKAVTQPKPGVFIYDFGQNFSGVERIQTFGAGTEIRARTGEVLNADGTLYTENLRTAQSTDRFILEGNGGHLLEPQFTYHGFRYLELTSPTPMSIDSGVVDSGQLNVQSVEGVVFHTDAPFDAQLTTGSPLINSLWSNILWGQRSNFVGLPTDCPQRDERLGWTADAQVFWRAASFNMDLSAFSRKYADDVRGTQLHSGIGPETSGALYGIFAPQISITKPESAAGWSDAGVIIPWTAWMQTGDTEVLKQNWAGMQTYLAAIKRTNPDYLWVNNAGTPFGDWLAPEGATKFPLVATAMWAYDVTLMQQMAHALGKTNDEAAYAALFERIKAAFTKSFIGTDGFVAGADGDHGSVNATHNPNAKQTGADTQTGYVLALYMHLAPEELRAAVAQKLVDKIEANHGLLATGFLGTPYLLSVLTETGHRALAYKLLLNTAYPSWGYLVDHGATTMWERWNGDQMRGDPSMNSYNHYAYGAVADWIYRYAAGVDTVADDPGFHTVYLHPAFDAQLGGIDFRYQSKYGEIDSAWTVANGAARWELTIPANAKGWMPLSATDAARYKVNGSALVDNTLVPMATRGGVAGYVLPAGSYTFAISGVQ